MDFCGGMLANNPPVIARSVREKKGNLMRLVVEPNSGNMFISLWRGFHYNGARFSEVLLYPSVSFDFQV